MADVKILIQGYTSEEKEGHSCSTVVLVRDKNTSIIIDPGTLPSQKQLIEALKKEGLGVNDINIVGITHSHMDHYRNIGIFSKAKALDYWGWWEGDVLSKSQDDITDDIMVIKTPGHSDDSITFLVKTKKGKIAICGDVFWKKDLPEKDCYANNSKRLKQSRKMILDLAEWVIPGHGGIFKVEKRQN